jgi:hypothetical protein
MEFAVLGLIDPKNYLLQKEGIWLGWSFQLPTLNGLV